MSTYTHMRSSIYFREAVTSTMESDITDKSLKNVNAIIFEMTEWWQYFLWTCEVSPTSDMLVFEGDRLTYCQG